MKLNVDAGFNIDVGIGSTGAAIHDDRGHFPSASRRGIPFVSEPATAEAHALRDGPILAGQIGCNRVEVNFDCMEVIDVMMNGGNSLGPAATIFEECTLLCRNFLVVVFAHSPREANLAAHALARHTEGSVSTVWHEEPPDFLVSILVNDVTIVDV